MEVYDVVIVGGGPAGLSAALFLGRCRRRVMVFDHGAPRNASAGAMHGFLTRDGISPAEFLALAREDLKRYPTVLLTRSEVRSVSCGDPLFTVGSDELDVQCRRVLLATGVVDELPPLQGVRALYGKSVFHCPYCDGWEVQDKRLALYGNGKSGTNSSIALTQWSDDVILFTNAGDQLTSDMRSRLQCANVRIEERRIAWLDGDQGLLQAIVLADGHKVEREAMFFSTDKLVRSHIPKSLGCNLNERGGLETGKHEATNISGIYAAGDVVQDLQFVAFAAAQGAKAAVGLNISLLEEDLQRKGCALCA